MTYPKSQSQFENVLICRWNPGLDILFLHLFLPLSSFVLTNKKELDYGYWEAKTTKLGAETVKINSDFA